MLYLSASAIKDYMECPRRYYYRRYFKSEAIPTEALSIGTVVHDTLETYWENREQAFEYANMKAMSYNISTKGVEKINQQLEKFFESFVWMLTPSDSIELEFSIPISTGCRLVGKIDRITQDRILLDWKTGSGYQITPDKLSKDPQFIIYDWAYERLYGRRPTATYYASLGLAKLVKFDRNKQYENILMNDIIPSIAREIQSKEFNTSCGLPTGFFKFSNPCANCVFREVCHSELANRDVAPK